MNVITQVQSKPGLATSVTPVRTNLLQPHSISRSKTFAAPTAVNEASVSGEKTTDLADTAFPKLRLRHDFGQIRIHAPAVPTTKLGSWLPAVGQMTSAGIAEAPLCYPSDLAQRSHTSALTVDGAIHLSFQAGRLPAGELNRILAHESVHVAQQRRGRRYGELPDVELEAHELAQDMLAGRKVRPCFRPASNTPLADTPYERMVVERARWRAALLRRYLDEWAAREARRLSTAHERDPLLERRRQMDVAMPVLVPPETYERMERMHLERLNRLPLRIEVTEDLIRFRVRFHVRFEGLSDSDVATRFPVLERNFLAGVQMVWNQRLRAMPLSGRRFEVVPELTLISAGAPRNWDFWLITVRPTDTGPMTYEGQTLGSAPGGVPTSVTDPMVDGGVMSIPPSHINRPSVLGHETLHLFGLVDRYMSQTAVSPTGRTTHQNIPLRTTGGRLDPLGAQQGPILAEDMTYLFERLGVYELEANRGLEVLRRLEETEGLTYGQVVIELHRQEEIIRLGRDPRSLLPERRDFLDRLIRDAENL